MNEELQGKLVEILASIQAAAGKTADFAMEQLPDIAQSYIVYGRVYASFSVALALLLIIGAIYAIRWAHKTDPNTEGVMIPASLFGGTAAFLGFIGVCATASNAMLVWFAPKVWLLKELASLIK